MNSTCGVVALGSVLSLLLASQGCSAPSVGVGDPCTPEQEYDATFSGFDLFEVNIESKSLQCATRVCLVNHFRGRVTCPYGQDAEGVAPSGQSGCVVPGTTTPIAPLRPTPHGDCVAAQCADRTADDAVYCSCRCADAAGNKGDGSVYCDCPESFACVPLVSSIGGDNEGLTGSYCVKRGTEFAPTSSCTESLDANDPSKCVQ